MELCIRSAGGTSHCLDITCAAPLPSSPPSLSSLHPVSIICHTPHHHLFSPQLDIQAPDRKDTIYQGLPCVEGTYWYFHLALAMLFALPLPCPGWVYEGMSQRVSGVPEGVQEMPKTRYCIGLFWANLDSHRPILWQVQKKKQVCKLCIPIS